MYKTLTTNLMVENVEKSLDFYRDILGFEVEASVPNEKGVLIFAILLKDGTSVMLQEKNSLVSEYSVLRTDKIKPTITLYFVVDDVEKYYGEMKNKCSVYVELHTTDYGAREFAILDPDGYPLTFAGQMQ
jgi:Uncharacterized protein conserved in bacteria